MDSASSTSPGYAPVRVTPAILGIGDLGGD